MDISYITTNRYGGFFVFFTFNYSLERYSQAHWQMKKSIREQGGFYNILLLLT
ncbi:hypothetical protein H8D51_03865 [bacterium]|nr:hypothetical protein [bacterium]